MKYFAILLVLLTTASCVKDKLEADTLILDGTWTWDHSIEYNYDSTNDTVIGTIIPASNYTDSYAIRIEEKGRVYSIKNGTDQDKYRLVLPHFKLGLCIDLSNSYEYNIHLNNSSSDTLAGCVNTDTLITNDFHLPLSKGSGEYPYYQHVFVK